MTTTYIKKNFTHQLAQDYLKEIQNNAHTAFDIVVFHDEKDSAVFSYRKLQIVFQFGELSDIEKIAPLIKQHIHEPIIERMLFYPMFYDKPTISFFNGIEKLQFLLDLGVNINTFLTPTHIDDLPQHHYIYHPRYMGQSLFSLTNSSEIKSIILSHPSFNPYYLYQDNFFTINFDDVHKKMKPVLYHAHILETGAYEENKKINSQDANTLIRYAYYVRQGLSQFIVEPNISLYEKILYEKKQSLIHDLNEHPLIQDSLKKDYEQFLYLKELDSKGYALNESHIKSNGYNNQYIIHTLMNAYQNKEILYEMVKCFILQNNTYAKNNIDSLIDEIHLHKIPGRHLMYEAICLNELDWVQAMTKKQMFPHFIQNKEEPTLIEFALSESSINSKMIEYLIQEPQFIKELDTRKDTTNVVNMAFGRKLNKIAYQLYKKGFKVNEKWQELIIRFENKDLNATINEVDEKNNKKLKI